MYVFLCVYELVKAYESSSIQYARTKIRRYLYNMDLYNAYIEHVTQGKEVWKQ